MKAVLSLFLILFCSTIMAQQNAVSWSFEVNQVDSEKGEYELIYHANISDGWHLYSQFLASEDAGPLPTEFVHTKNENINLYGDIQEEQPHSEMDDAFGVVVNYFEGQTRFVQNVTLAQPKNTMLEGSIYYMVCSESMCVPEEVNYSFSVEP